MKLFGKKDDNEKYVIEIVNLEDPESIEPKYEKLPEPKPIKQPQPPEPDLEPQHPLLDVIDEANADKLGYEQVESIFDDDDEETPLPEPAKPVIQPVKRRGRPPNSDRRPHSKRQTQSVCHSEWSSSGSLVNRDEFVPVEAPQAVSQPESQAPFHSKEAERVYKQMVSKVEDDEEEGDDDMFEKKETMKAAPTKDDMDFMDKDVEAEEVPSVQDATKQFIEKEQQELEQDEQGAYKQQFGQDEYISEDEARARIATMLINRKNLEMMSELNDFEIFKLSIVVSIAQKYNVPLIQLFADKLLGFKVSRAREGRREVKDVASPTRKDGDKKSVMDMILGGKKL